VFGNFKQNRGTVTILREKQKSQPIRSAPAVYLQFAMAIANNFKSQLCFYAYRSAGFTVLRLFASVRFMAESSMQ
jgi:hypothetical protein